MPDFLTLWSSMLTTLCSFLMSEPVYYFVGAILLLFTAGIVKRICTI